MRNAILKDCSIRKVESRCPRECSPVLPAQHVKEAGVGSANSKSFKGLSRSPATVLRYTLENKLGAALGRKS